MAADRSGRDARIQVDLDIIHDCLEVLRANPELRRALESELLNANVLVDLAKTAGIDMDLTYDVARELLCEHSLQARVRQRAPILARRVSPETQERIRALDRQHAHAVPQNTDRHREIADELGIGESTVRKYVRR